MFSSGETRTLLSTKEHVGESLVKKHESVLKYLEEMVLFRDCIDVDDLRTHIDTLTYERRFSSSFFAKVITKLMVLMNKIEVQYQLVLASYFVSLSYEGLRTMNDEEIYHYGKKAKSCLDFMRSTMSTSSVYCQYICKWGGEELEIQLECMVERLEEVLRYRSGMRKLVELN
jgi:hypothetical protein